MTDSNLDRTDNNFDPAYFSNLSYIPVSSKADKQLFTLVDREDFLELNRFKWRLDANGYVVRGEKVKGKYICHYMHRDIMYMHNRIELPYMTNPKREQPAMKLQVDHINNDRTDNRKCNLRVCMPGQNIRNRPKWLKETTGSKYKGVCKSQKGWVTHVVVEGRSIYVGTFPSEKMAAHYYNLAAIQLHGEFASLNDLS